MSNTKYGYARVSSKSQEDNSSLESQKQELVRNGILESNIIIEVGSAIKIANGQKESVAKQGKKIGAKIVYQENFWSNTTKTSELENLNPTASLPQSPNNILGIVDNFDVPSSEKAFMEASVLKGSQNNTNITFLNNN
jgi:hypothetical protein